MLPSPCVSVKYQSSVYKGLLPVYPPTGFCLIHSCFLIGLSTGPSTLQAFNHILDGLHTLGLMSFFSSFPIHSPPSIFFLSQTEHLKRVPVPYIQSWRLKFPASANLCKAWQSTPAFLILTCSPSSPQPSTPPLHCQGLGSQLCPQDHMETKPTSPHGKEGGSKEEGVTSCLGTPISSDCECGDWVWQGDREQGFHVTAAPLSQNFPHQGWD